jgi:hypothetical protein
MRKEAIPDMKKASAGTGRDPPNKRLIKPRQRRGRKYLAAVSRRNGTPKKLFMVTGYNSRALRGQPLHRGSGVGRAYADYLSEYRAHLGNDLSVVQTDLVDQAARLKLVSNLCYAVLMERGLFDKQGNPRPVLGEFRRACAEHRAVLLMLGIRRTKELTLGDVLREEQQRG